MALHKRKEGTELILMKLVHRRNVLNILLTLGSVMIVVQWMHTGGTTRNDVTGRSDVPLPTSPVSIADAAIHGNRESEVIIIEYSDFQCPYCAKFARETMPVLREDLLASGKVALVFKHLPLKAVHPYAVGAAVAASCTGDSDRFWLMHDAMFRQQDSLQPDNLTALATSVGVDRDKFLACTQAGGNGRVEADVAEAKKLGINSVPTFLVGRRIQPNAVAVESRISGAVGLERLRAEVQRVTRPS